MFCYTSASYKPWGDYLAEIDIGIWEQQLDDDNWAAWVRFKREIAQVSLKYGGSISNCHGTTRAGDAELVPRGDGRRLGRHEEDQADARSEQHHESRQADARRGVSGSRGLKPCESSSTSSSTPARKPNASQTV